MEHNDLDEWYRLENRDEYVNARDHKNAFAKKDKTLYSNVIYASFPRRGDLPIVSQDFTYTMDIMYMTTLDTEDDRAILSKQKIQNRRSTFYNIRAPDRLNERNDYLKEWCSILVFVETTSRKAYAYPMHGKHPREVLFWFKKFLEDCDFRIAKLLSDKGTEYSMIKKYINKYKICHYYQANTTQNHHTVLSRVDRFIRTLRDMFRRYFAEALESEEWVLFVPTMIKTYNSTKHNSLFLKDGKKRVYYTPNQVFENPKLRRRIKIKDYLAKYKNYRYVDKFLRIGTIVYYRVFSSKVKYSKHKGFIGIYPGIIRRKIGNSFEIQLKNSDDKWRDEEKGVVTHFTGPYAIVSQRDLIPYSHVRGVNRSRSKYNISKMMDEKYKLYQKKMREIKEKDERERWMNTNPFE